MTAVYSLELFAVEFGSLGPVLCFTVPDGHVYILRDVDSIAPSGRDGFILSSQPENLNWAAIPYTGSVGGLQYGAWRGRQVFSAGQSLYIAATEDLCWARGSGYDLTT